MCIRDSLGGQIDLHRRLIEIDVYKRQQKDSKIKNDIIGNTR